MNILFLCDMYPESHNPYHGGFIKEQVEALSGFHKTYTVVIERFFVNIGVKSIIKEMLSKKPMAENIARNVVKIKYPVYTLFNFPLHQLNGYFIRRAVEKILKQANFAPDIIHAYKSFPAGFAGVCLKKMFKCPLVITELQGPFEGYLKDRLTRKRVFKAINGADRTVYSEFQIKSIKKSGIKHNRFANICFGIDERKFVLNPRTSQNRKSEILKGNIKLLVIGRVEALKGIDVLIKAVEAVKIIYPNIHLDIYGPLTKESDNILKMITESNLSQSIYYKGTVDSNEMPGIIDDHDILVSASLIETFGMTIIEALACGKPVVAARCGGPEETVNNEVGVLVEKNDVKAFADGIKCLIREYNTYDPDRLRRYALDNFGQRVVTDKLNKLYKELVNN